MSVWKAYFEIKIDAVKNILIYVAFWIFLFCFTKKLLCFPVSYFNQNFDKWTLFRGTLLFGRKIVTIILYNIWLSYKQTILFGQIANKARLKIKIITISIHLEFGILLQSAHIMNAIQETVRTIEIQYKRLTSAMCGFISLFC